MAARALAALLEATEPLPAHADALEGRPEQPPLPFVIPDGSCNSFRVLSDAAPWDDPM